MKKIWLMAGISAALLVAGCSAIQLSKTPTPSQISGTPVPEKPVSEMSPQPPHGTAGGDSIGDPYIPSLGNAGYDVQQYLIEMTFSPTIDAITATVTLTPLVTMNDLGRLSLDFSGYTVDSVLVDDLYAAYYRSPDKLYVDLPAAYKKGNALVVRVSYHGKVIPVNSQYIPGIPLGLRTIPGHDLTYAFGEPDGAHTWFPCNDHPRDKAAFSYKITVPKALTAVANGKLLNTVGAGDWQTYYWYEQDAFAPYLATVAVGKYQRLDNPPIGTTVVRHYVIAGDTDFSTQLSDTGEMVEYFNGLIGPYPFDEVGFAVILTVEGEPNFAEETQTMVLMDRTFLVGGGASGVMAHELAHQWFGDAVSLSSWNEAWLKEGMATYLMVMWLDNQNVASLDAVMSNIENILVQHANELNFPMNQPPYEALYGPSTYDKGAWVFHMLRQQIGDKDFTDFLREYYRSFKGGVASTADVQSVAQKVSGMDLTTFFNQWVYGSGIPSLAITWSDQPGGVGVQVCQAGGGQVYTLPLEIQLQAADGSTEQEVIQVDQLEEQVTYSTPFAVSGIQADPGQKVLAGITVDEVPALAGCKP